MRICIHTRINMRICRDGVRQKKTAQIRTQIKICVYKDTYHDVHIRTYIRTCKDMCAQIRTHLSVFKDTYRLIYGHA